MIKEASFFQILFLLGLMLVWPAQGQRPIKFQATEKAGELEEIDINQKSLKFQAQKIYGSHLSHITLAKVKKSDQAPSAQSSLIKGAGGSVAEQKVPESSSGSTERQAVEAQGNKQRNKQRNPQQRNPQEETPPENQQGRSQTAGILLEYRRMPPSGKEQADIFRVAEENDLVKTDELPSSKLWLFSWKDDKEKDSLYAFFACLALDSFPSVESCQPNYILRPRSDFMKDFESIQLPPASVLPEQAPKLDQTDALQTCNIIQAHQPQSYSEANTLAGRYWAQNMIGADLLREEIKKKT